MNSGFSGLGPLRGPRVCFSPVGDREARCFAECLRNGVWPSARAERKRRLVGQFEALNGFSECELLRSREVPFGAEKAPQIK
jgi:hypothetical protein